MTQYIDKTAVVAEIERQRKAYIEEPSKYKVLSRILSFLDTLEVKEIDLQSEIDRVWDNTSYNFSVDGWKEFEEIAKHFFEFGLQAKKKESNV